MNMNTAQARVIDPILTTAARGYQNAEYVGSALFPFVAVQQRGGKILTFGKEAFRQYATGRAPGTNTKRIQIGYAGSNYTLESHSLEAAVPIELQQEAGAVPQVDLAAGSVNVVQDIMAARLERAQANLATDDNNYNGSSLGLGGTSQWSHANSDPINQVEIAKEVVRQQIGRRPNTLLLSAKVFAALRTNASVLERIKYTGLDVPTTDLLASLFGVARVVVGDAVQEDNAGVMTDIWGNNAVLAYTEIGGIASMGRPTFGYTYRLGGYPIVEPAYYDNNSKTWYYPVTDEVAPVIAGAEAGFLFTNVTL